MEDYIDTSSTFISMQFDFSFCRLLDKTLFPSSITLNIGIEILDEMEMEFALDKINYWIDNHVNSALVVSASNDIGFSLFLDEHKHPILNNNLMIVPHEPTDNCLLFVFQSKIDALADDAFDVVSIDINSSDACGFTISHIGETDGSLPTMEEWIPNGSWFDVPWWNRSDISTFDTEAPKDANLLERPSWARDFEFLRKKDEEHTAIIINGGWEPRIVE